MIRSLAVGLLFSFAVQLQADNVEIKESLVVADACSPKQGCLFTWTLPSMASKGFEMAQQRIGPINPDFHFLGIEFKQTGPPSIWFPGGERYVLIQLTASAMTDRKRALFQLGHEILHVTTATVGNVNILEEGLAAELALDFTRAMGEPIKDAYTADSRYLSALRAVRCLRDYHPDLNSQLKRLRKEGHVLGKIPSKILAIYLDKIPLALVKAVSRPFDDVGKVGKIIDGSCSG